MREIRDLLDELKRTPGKVSSLIDDLSHSAVSTRPSPDEFSVIEHVCHLRDIEIEGYGVRIQRILGEQNPDLHDIDGSRLAAERDYNLQNLGGALAAFTQARQQNLALLDQASEDQFEREGKLQGVGTVSLRQLLEMMCEHDESHLDELKVARHKLQRTATT